MEPATPDWAREIRVEDVGGVPYRMYAKRPHRTEQLLSLVANWGDRAHIIQGDRVVTFRGLSQGTAAKARQLRIHGVGRGDNVVIFGWNSPDWVMNFWACIKIGAVPVLANAWWGETEIDDCMALIQPVLVLADARSQDRIPLKWRRGPWAADENASLPAGARENDVGVPGGENAPAIIVFTSGSSGKAKAVILSHRAVLSGLQMMLHITKQLPPDFDAEKSEITLHTGPLFHVGGPQVMLRSIATGNTLVFLSARFDPADVLALIERHRITRWTAVPTMIARTLDHPEVNLRDLGSLRSIGMGGSPVSPELLERMRTGLPGVQPSVAIGYGLTENTGPATTASGKDSESHPGTCGRALPLVEIRLLAQEKLKEGEVLIRSPTQMSGYYGLEESPIDSEGWLHTGDLGRMDDEGRLWITGRTKEMIIRGGENIAPAAVERALCALPQVAEAAVLGIPHAELGEEVFAFVVLKSAANPEDLRGELRKTLSSFAIPSRWHLQEDRLPTNQTGKIDKKELLARALAATGRI
jgi:acyl-CoA synthetase (AMP-forming)/AMP-acid ligase II